MIELDLRMSQGRFTLAVELKLASGAVAVLGPSGSGKTTLLEVVAGVRRGAAGRIVIDGEVLLDTKARRHLPPERRRLGYVPQDAALFPHLDVRRNVRFGLRPGEGAERRFDEAVALLEIAPLLSQYPATLSGGERQRVALARALATAPRLLLLDEPLAALDVALKDRIFPYLLRIRDEAGIAMLYVTHSVGEALALAREVVLLGAGRVVAHGPAAEVLREGRVAALDPAAVLDNVVTGVIGPGEGRGTALLDVAGATAIVVPSAGTREGARATYHVPAEDVLLANHPLTGISARNVFAGTVVAVESVGLDAIVRVGAGAIEWRARLTPAAVRELELTPGRAVWVAIKTHTFRRLG